MTTHTKQIFSAVSILSAGLFLSGCSWNKDSAQLPADASGKDTIVQSRRKSILLENQELNFAKELVNCRDCVRAFQIFQKYASKGNTEAEAWLGRCYMNGIGTAVDHEKAYEFLKKAAEKNNPWGLNGLGVCMQYGYGIPVNLQEAVKLFRKAADMNHPLGTINLARVYANRKGGFYDAKMAESYFKKAVDLNAPSAKSIYAAFLYDSKRYAEAIPLIMQTLDSEVSRWMMAMCCQNGWGIPVDISRAVELAERHFRETGPSDWSAEICCDAGLEELTVNGMTETAKRRFKYAAEQGNAEAQYLYANFLGNAKDEQGASSYMIKSADKGFRPAIITAGKMLREQKDFQNAIKYFMLASINRKTQKQAAEYLSNIYHFDLKMPKAGACWDVKGAALGSDLCRNELAANELLSQGDEHFARAAALFAEGRISNNECSGKMLEGILSREYDKLRTLADKKNSDALLTLGILGCLDGKDHPNVPIAIELLEESAKLNNAAACRILGNLYRNGGLAKKDLKKAFSWYQKGAEFGDAESAKFAALMVYYEEAFKDTKLEDFKKIFDRALQLEVTSVVYEYGCVMEYVAKDPKKAEDLYRLAASFDDERAMFRLYELLCKTNGKESYDFLKQAVNLSYSKAELRMGDIQRIWENPRKAFIYYLRARADGDKIHASCRLAECFLNGYGCEINLKCFWNNADEAYKNGSSEVCYLLGNVYREGKICARDDAKAKAYFEEGAKRGNEECRKALKGL